jgi:S1-C subfamily serine protease
MRRGYLGVGGSTIPLDRRIVVALGLQQARAVRVLSVEPGSPADRAGLRPGDLLLDLDGQAMASVDALYQALHPSGSAATAGSRCCGRAAARRWSSRCAAGGAGGG